MPTNKTIVGYGKDGSGRKISAPSQSHGVAGASSDGPQSRTFSQNGTQEDQHLEGGQVYELDGLNEIGHHVKSLGGLVGVKRAGKLTKDSGSQNLFAGNAGPLGVNAQHPWTKNSGSQNAY